jgi:type III pantothenate kinase
MTAPTKAPMTAASPARPISPLLLIDAGNSRVKWALDTVARVRLAAGAFDQPGGDDPDAAMTRRRSSSALQESAKIPKGPKAEADSNVHASASRDTGWNNLPHPAGAWISNVAGTASGERIAAMLDAQWPGLPTHTIATGAHACGVTNDYREPSQLGSDRWAGLIGARAAYPGEHLLLVTLGTATTIEVLRADGHFIGGLIAPGWSLMMRSLGQHTAQLPTLTAGAARGILSDAGTDMPLAIDTPTALSRGCLLAQAALIERLRDDTGRRLAGPLRVVLGGGAADAVAGELRFAYTRHDHLVLAGLGLLAGEPVTASGRP